MAAVLTAGDGALLSRLAVAELRGVWRYRAPRIDVVVPRERRVQTTARIHRCRNLHRRDVTSYRGIPVTTIARMLVDLADELHKYELANVIHEAAFKGIYIPLATQDAMDRAKGRRLQPLRQAIALHDSGSAGVKSRHELAFVKRLERQRLPEPLVNVHVAGYEVDMHWPGLKLAIEIDGWQHSRPRTRREDEERDRALALAGYELLRFRDTALAQAASAVSDRVRPTARSWTA